MPQKTYMLYDQIFAITAVHIVVLLDSANDVCESKANRVTEFNNLLG